MLAMTILSFHPIQYGWREEDNKYYFQWFEGDQLRFIQTITDGIYQEENIIVKAVLAVNCDAVPLEKIVEVPEGHTVQISCESKDGNHSFAFWELASRDILGPGNEYDENNMDRTTKILMKALSNKDDSIIEQLRIPKYETTKGLDVSEIEILLTKQLRIPKYETTKGLDVSEIEILLTNCHKLFIDKFPEPKKCSELAKALEQPSRQQYSSEDEPVSQLLHVYR
ncbi:hypothetical protein QE152_g36825 [Popillia japonica]|uniref:Uncharacterized protein n=1 Tax=Popillia japonica TaxID=7064 RepID=A0AAW1IBG2_POPJA